MPISSLPFACRLRLLVRVCAAICVAALVGQASAGYLGDAWAEGANITVGSKQDSASTAVTYSFASPGATYTNTTGSVQQITLSKVNFYTGTGTGTLTPFASVYRGDHTPASIRNAANYNVVSIGKTINVIGNSGLNRADFLVGGKNPVIHLSPKQVLSVGFLSSNGQIVRNDGVPTGAIDYVIIADSLPKKLPDAFRVNANETLDRTLKFNVEYSVSEPAVFYIGDAAAEGANITNGIRQDSAASDVVYAFVSPGATYANTTDFIQRITFTQVNFFVGNNSGSLVPFVAVYKGDQTSTAIKAASNYRVVAIGDTINVTAFSGLQNKSFLVAGQNPVVEVLPNEVVSVGFLSSNGQIVRNDNTPTGVIDYVTIANTLPANVPGALNADANQTLDRTIKFNVGFTIQNPPFYIGDSAAEGANVTKRTSTRFID